MSNVGKWDSWYKNLDNNPSSFVYGDTLTYELGAKFLSDCKIVEDWGTGAGGFKRYRVDAIGIDGSDTIYADKKYIDLTSYTSECDGIFMRHVLEHNYQWEDILHNLIKSFTNKACIVLFTEFAENETVEIAHNLIHGVDVPDLSLCKSKFMRILDDGNINISIEKYNTATGYGIEYVIYLAKGNK